MSRMIQMIGKYANYLQRIDSSLVNDPLGLFIQVLPGSNSQKESTAH
jgi:hypothetical protein